MWKCKQALAIPSRLNDSPIKVTNQFFGKFPGRALFAVLLGLLLTGPIITSPAHADGIKVHGNWVVTVTNPDGTVAQERVFRNALTGNGQMMLVTLLGSSDSALYGEQSFYPDARGWSRAWDIQVAASGTVDTPECNDNLATPEFLIDVLQLAAVVSAQTASSFTLSRNLALPGSCLTGASYSISNVNTAINGSTYYEGGEFDTRIIFSSKTLAIPITGILPDQVVTLKVTYSFE